MPPAASLIVAAEQSFTNMYPIWAGGGATFATKLNLFWQQLIKTPDVFPETNINNHPIGNWCTLIAAVTDQISSALVVSFGQFATAQQYVYRVCYVGNSLHTANLITLAQTNALLAAYNAAFT